MAQPTQLKDFTQHQGKGSKSEILPSRHALNTLTGGDPLKRTIGDYAKLTPTGAQAFGAPTIQAMSKAGIQD